MARLSTLALTLVFGAASALKLHVAPTAADVKKLHDKMSTIESNLEHMVDNKNGPLAHAKVGPALQVFVGELKTVLKETENMKDTTKAMQKLEAAKAGLSGLTADLTHRQEELMKEDETQRESLLLGVLMTHQSQPMDQQLKILKSEDFAKLAVSAELLAKHDEKTPLFQQVAAYLDKHHGKQEATAMTSQANQQYAKTQALAKSLKKRVQSLQDEYRIRETRYAKVMEELHAKQKGASKSEKHVIEVMKKKEQRSWKKWAAIRKHDIKTMQDAVDAVERGDVKALEKTRAALMDSLKAMKNQNGGFLVLAQLGHQLMGKDCPYCAAQCVDKCHSEGKPYIQCMTDCADAGKGF